MCKNNQEELELFKRPVVQSDILNGKFEKIYPITELENSGPIEFLIELAIDHFLDLRQSYPSIKFKVMDGDGLNLAASVKVGFINYPIASLLQEVDVILNNNLISSSTNTYAYRAMLEVSLGYNQGAKISYLTMGLYSKDTATKIDLVSVGGANGGIKARSQYIKESKLVEVSGLLHCNLVNSDRPLLNGLPLKIVLH